jgi:hypothetical protein
MSEFSVNLNEYLQAISVSSIGVNQSSSEFTVFLDDSIVFVDESLLVINEQIAEHFALTESFTPSHEPWTALEDSFGLTLIEADGVALLKDVTFVVHSSQVEPVRIQWMNVEILHGVDVFYLEASDGLYFLSDTHIANVFLSWCYESIDMAWEPTSATRGVWKSIALITADRINYRHTVEQEYYFNSKAYDYIFAYDKYAWGWGKYLTENFDITLWLRGAYGRSINEVFTPHLALISSWTGNQDVLEQIMAYDQAIFEKFYTKAVEESLGLAVSMDVDSRMIHTAIESLALGETPIPEVQRFLQAVESLAVTQAASVTFGHCPGVVESLDLVNSPELLRVIPQVLVDVAELLDDPVSKWLALCLLQETINDSDKAIR